MQFDDVVIGSGLAALGTVLGLPAHRRVLVLAGPANGQFHHYDEHGRVPCDYVGEGGLGNHWHGVIPTACAHLDRFGAARSSWRTLFEHFYAHASLDGRIGQPWLFVPWQPIRPRREFRRLQKLRTLSQFAFVHDVATALRPLGHGGAVVTTGEAGEVTAQRVWIAAGALQTPVLLDRSFGRISRGTVSDHVICYIGHADGLEAPQVSRGREGAFFPASYRTNGESLYTLRPARFSCRRLDHGIEHKAAFAMPAGSALLKLSRRASAGLITEAVYNRFGVGARAPRHSVYAQVLARDAYAHDVATGRLAIHTSRVREAVEGAREHQPFREVTLSRRREITLPGIHLHHSVAPSALHAVGVNLPGAPIQVVDASPLVEIGAEHHSFKMLVAAHDRAVQATQ